MEGKAEIMMVSIQGGCQALGRMAVGGHLDVLSLAQPFLWRMDGLIQGEVASITLLSYHSVWREPEREELTKSQIREEGREQPGILQYTE